MKEDIKLSSKLSTTGIYTLLLFLSKQITVDIGKLGKQKFPMGYYTYAGSALGKGASSLQHRITRHMKKEKRKFWHIDYLLADENFSVEAIIITETNENMECKTNQYIKTIMGAKVPVKEFGASDCRKNCESHLLYFQEIENTDFLIQKLAEHLQSASGILSVYVIH